MSGNYSDGSDRDTPLLRALSALMTGRDAAAPACHQRRALLHLARVHRVERLVARSIRLRGGDLAAWFGDCDEDQEIERTERKFAVVDAIRTQELRRVIDGLVRVSGTLPIVFKGAALAHSHYPAPWLRPRLDSDILIPSSHVTSALATLQDIGYEHAVNISGSLVSSQTSLSRVDAFGIDHALDVHWKIANRHAVASVLSYDDIAGRAVPLPAIGPAARVPADVDALLIACVHRAAHHRDSEELLWLFDIHLIAERLAPADWHVFVANARGGRVTAICARGLGLAVDWFGTPVPDDVLHALDIRHMVPEPSAVFLSKDSRLVDNLKSDLGSLSLRGKVRLLFEHLFPPVAYISERYQVTGPTSIAFAYLRRIVLGIPQWLADRRQL
jgi:hypothetical protein